MCSKCRQAKLSSTTRLSWFYLKILTSSLLSMPMIWFSLLYTYMYHRKKMMIMRIIIEHIIWTMISVSNVYKRKKKYSNRNEWSYVSPFTDNFIGTIYFQLYYIIICIYDDDDECIYISSQIVSREWVYVFVFCGRLKWNVVNSFIYVLLRKWCMCMHKPQIFSALCMHAYAYVRLICQNISTINIVEWKMYIWRVEVCIRVCILMSVCVDSRNWITSPGDVLRFVCREIWVYALFTK